MRRWTLFAAGVALSVAVTVVLWAAGIPGFFLFLAFPFLFFPFRSRTGSWSTSTDRRSVPAGACPSCGASRTAAHRFCPSCGSRFP